MSLVQSLAENKCQVLAIDSNMELVKKAQGFVTQAVMLDARDPEALKSVGINEMDAVVVAIGSSQESSMLATMILKDLGLEHVIAKAVTELHGRFLKKVGADQVIYPEIDSGKRLGRNLTLPNIIEQIEFGEDHGVFEIKVPESWVGKTLGDLNVRAKYGVSIIAIQADLKDATTDDKEVKGKEETDREKAAMNVSPLATTILKDNDLLLILGHVDQIKKLTK